MRKLTYLQIHLLYALSRERDWQTADQLEAYLVLHSAKTFGVNRARTTGKALAKAGLVERELRSLGGPRRAWHRITDAGYEALQRELGV